jgi:predicted metal-binding membrane protein
LRRLTVSVYGGGRAAIKAASWRSREFRVAVEDRFDRLDASGRAIARIAVRPAFPVGVVVGLAVVLAWAVLVAMAGMSAEIAPGEVGPGAELLRHLPRLPVPAFVERFFQLCLSPAGAGTTEYLLALVAMWFLMAVAMMLPSAAPMIRTYCEIADTAAARSEPVVHPLVLVAGYLATWLLASLAFAALAFAIGGMAGSGGPLPLAAGGLALALAGAYQFSGLKEACLEKCRNPFAILFSRWSTAPSSVFRLGVEQGLWCLGCCWALMLVMFAVGLSNLFWMALLGLLAFVEKLAGTSVLTRATGVILLVWAGALLVVSAA